MAENRKRNGRHPEKVLSATRVRAVTKPGRYIDGNGLYLIVDQSGAKRWMLRTIIHGKRCDVGLGGLAIVSLAQARDEAARLRKIARAGSDPIGERRARQTVPTFEQAARQVHESQSKSFRNDKHKAQWLATLDTYVFPIFGSRRVDHVESADVLRALSPGWRFQKRPAVSGNGSKPYYKTAPTRWRVERSVGLIQRQVQQRAHG